MQPSLTAVGYVRVSTDEQHASGGGISAQQAAIRAECERRGWQLLRIVGEDAGARSDTLDRAGLQQALQILDGGAAEVLVVAKLDRLSRSVSQGAQVMDRAKQAGWALVALDFGLDTTTPAGEMVANVILSMAQYERRLNSQRTKDALAAKRAQGVRLGRPQTLPDDVVERILTARRAGLSSRRSGSNSKPTEHRAREEADWHASTVKKVCDSQAAQRLSV